MLDKRVLFAQRPGVHLASVLVAASVPADEMISSTVDLAWQQDSVHAQVEYVHDMISDFAGADPTVSGWSADAGYFLAGGRRGYDTVKGGWSRVKPGEEQLARLGHYLMNLNAGNAHYLDVTRASDVGNLHGYFVGDPVKTNKDLRAMFGNLFEGGTAETNLTYRPDINAYVLAN